MASQVGVWEQEHPTFAKLLDLPDAQIRRFHGGETPDYQFMLTPLVAQSPGSSASDQRPIRTFICIVWCSTVSMSAAATAAVRPSRVLSARQQ